MTHQFPSSSSHVPPLCSEGGTRNIVAFVGENENGILREASKSFMALVECHGYSGHVIDLHSDGWLDRLKTLINEGIAVAWGAAGIGAGLASEGKSLWDSLGIPFISVMSDTPCWAPSNHCIDARFVANGYLFQDWLDMQRSCVRSPQISSLLPLGALANPKRDAVPWSRRGNRMLFVKTGGDPERFHGEWGSLPPRFRAILEDASAAALAAPVGDISQFVVGAIRGQGLVVDGRPEVLFGLMRQVDLYVRDTRSTAMARALLPLPVDVVGRGWEHVTSAGGRARFSEAVDAALLPSLYADTQFLVNTMPNFSHRTHERVLGGFAARCCVVTNENADMASRFSGLPSYLPLDLRSSDLADRLAEIHGSAGVFDDATQPALDLVAADFAPEAFMAGLIGLAAEVSASASPYFSGHMPRRLA